MNFFKKKMNWFIVPGIMMALIVYVLLNRETVYEINAGAHSLGIVQDAALVVMEYEKLKADQVNNHPDYIHLPSEELSIIKKVKWFPEDDTKRVLTELPALMNPLVEAYEIRVNGAAAAAVVDKAAAEKAIDQIKAPYIAQAGNEVELVEEITVQKISIQPEVIVKVEQAVEQLSSVEEEAKLHQVEDGDTLWDIAQQESISFEQIQLMNSQLPGLLKAGQNIVLSPQKNLVNVRIKSTKVEQQTIPFRTIVKSENVQEQAGKEGLKEIVYQEVAVNGIPISSEKLEEKILADPIDRVEPKKARVQIASPKANGKDFIWPADGGVITSGFGMRDGEFHKGYDIAAAKTLQIKASAPGKVIFSGWKNDYGNLIIVSHSDGYTTYYAHNKENNASVNDVVKQGQVIAVMGSTGDSTGVHLHFEIRIDGKAVDPGKYFK